MKLSSPLMPLMLAAMILSLAGCKDSNSSSDASLPGVSFDAEDIQPGHAHPTEGPHHGALIELGNEEYHAELVHDEAAGSVTIYVLNAAATGPVPIDASEITINVKHDGKPKQFKLAASPDTGDPEGKSSRFISTEAELGEHLHDDAAEPKLVLSIAGKSFRGVIDHHHDHDH